MQFFLQGLTMGLAYVAPIGMQNLFVINAALTSSRRRALLTALIVLFFDATLSISCFYGVGALMDRYEWLQALILCIGSLIVMSIGVNLIRSRQDDVSQSGRTMPLGKTISKACVVTWCNPQAILDGTMMLGAFHVTLSMSQATPFMAGVVSASFLWFFGLTFFISLYSHKFNAKALRIVNVVCGAVIAFYGAKLFLELPPAHGLGISPWSVHYVERDGGKGYHKGETIIQEDRLMFNRTVFFWKNRRSITRRQRRRLAHVLRVCDLAGHAAGISPILYRALFLFLSPQRHSRRAALAGQGLRLGRRLLAYLYDLFLYGRRRVWPGLAALRRRWL